MEFLELYLHIWWGWSIFDMFLEKIKNLMKKYFFDHKISDFEIFLTFSKISDFKISKCWKCKNSKILEMSKKISKSEIFWSKKILASKFLFFPKSYQICSILTKHEGITRRTPKVMLIFRFFRCWLFDFSFNSPPEANPQCKKQRVSEDIRSPVFWTH